MKTLAACLIVFCCAMATAARAEGISIVYSRAATPQSEYAIRKLKAALVGTAGGPEIRLETNRSRLGPEEFSITPGSRTITVTGGDNRGLIYGALALAEQLRNGIRLEKVEAT